MQVIEYQYFGCINYWINLVKYKVAEISLYEKYQKMTFCNRTVILGSNGLIDLSIPIQGGRNCGLNMNDVKIDYSQDWKNRHWRSILSSYGKAPFFEFYKSDVERLIFSNNIYLFDFNYEILLWIIKILKLELSIGKLIHEDDKMATMLDNRFLWKPSNFKEMQYQYSYCQVFEHKFPFHYNLSILDLIFCEGPSTKQLLVSAGL